LNSLKNKFISSTIVIIGGGAAGFFCALNIGLNDPSKKVIVLEKSSKFLAKVRISGGGRCNVTNACTDISELVKNYPRGGRELRQVFHRFSTPDTINWFAEQGVVLKTEDDGRMFPMSDTSETIINCFINLANKLNIDLHLNCEVNSIIKSRSGFDLKTKEKVFQADAVVCAIGGHPKAGTYDLIKHLGHTIVPPIPSLFTINLPGAEISKSLQGIAVKEAAIKIEGTSLKWQGPILITHWGLSGPAVLKLSAFGAEELFRRDYKADLQLNWIWPIEEQEAFATLQSIKSNKNKMHPYNCSDFGLPKRLWEFLCNESQITNELPWAEIPDRKLRVLAKILCQHSFQMSGKTTFKEEFVTCGGIELKEVDFKTMQSKIVPGLYFCGESLNIDGVTGGFNFQSAWSTAWLAASAICN
jgi:hypothetical protein